MRELGRGFYARPLNESVAARCENARHGVARVSSVWELPLDDPHRPRLKKRTEQAVVRVLVAFLRWGAGWTSGGEARSETKGLWTGGGWCSDCHEWHEVHERGSCRRKDWGPVTMAERIKAAFLEAGAKHVHVQESDEMSPRARQETAERVAKRLGLNVEGGGTDLHEHRSDVTLVEKAS